MFSPEEIIAKLKKLIKIIKQQQVDMGEITSAQSRIIFPIFRDGKGYTMHELAKMSGVTKGLVSRTIADLEAKGFVERCKTSEKQDRNFKIVLSEKAKQLAAEKMQQAKKNFDKWQSRLKHEDFETFIKVLVIITETHDKEQT